MSSICLERRHADSSAADGHCKKGFGLPKAACSLHFFTTWGHRGQFAGDIYSESGNCIAKKSGFRQRRSWNSGQSYISQPLMRCSLMLCKLFYLILRSFWPQAFSELLWSVAELRRACTRLKNNKDNKASDEIGLASELWQHVLDEFLLELLQALHVILEHRNPAAARGKHDSRYSAKKDAQSLLQMPSTREAPGVLCGHAVIRATRVGAQRSVLPCSVG